MKWQYIWHIMSRILAPLGILNIHPKIQITHRGFHWKSNVIKLQLSTLCLIIKVYDWGKLVLYWQLKLFHFICCESVKVLCCILTFEYRMMFNIVLLSEVTLVSSISIFAKPLRELLTFTKRGSCWSAHMICDVFLFDIPCWILRVRTNCLSSWWRTIFLHWCLVKNLLYRKSLILSTRSSI